MGSDWLIGRRAAASMRALLVHPCVESLENRTLLSTVNAVATYNALAFNSYTPPDTIAAAGPTKIVEAINLQLATYDYYTGARLSQVSLTSFFNTGLGGVLNGSDPVVAYDEYTGQFVVGMLDFNTSNQSRFDLAISNDYDPADGWYFARYNLNDGTGGFDFADYPRMGYNADAYVFSFNMFPNIQSFNHVNVLSVDKGSLTGYRYTVPGGTSHFTMAPAAMHNSSPGDPIWFVEASTSGGTNIRVERLDNELSTSPTLTQYSVSVAAIGSYSNPPTATQPGGGNITANDDRMLNAAMDVATGQLVAAHSTRAVDGTTVVHARWYQFDVNSTPFLVQGGDIDPGPGVDTYFPSIEINYNEDDLGMTFMESSPTEYMSMYAAGLSIFDGSGVMATQLMFAGTSRYTSTRTGDYSGISIDPNDGYTFWIANEYKGSSPFNTGIAAFYVTQDTSPSPGHLHPTPVPAGPSTQDDIASVGEAVRSTQSMRLTAVQASANVATLDRVDAQMNPITPTESGANTLLVAGRLDGVYRQRLALQDLIPNIDSL